jgi:hypothetical protein
MYCLDKAICWETIAPLPADPSTLTVKQLKSIITAIMKKSSEQLNEAYIELGELLASRIVPYLKSKSRQRLSESEDMLRSVMQATWVSPTWITRVV